MESITDGTSNTFLAGEKHVVLGHFGEGGESGLGTDASITAIRKTSTQPRIAGPSNPLAISPHRLTTSNSAAGTKTFANSSCATVP